MKYFLYLICIFTIYYLLFTIDYVYAASMSNESFFLENKNLEIKNYKTKDLLPITQQEKKPTNTPSSLSFTISHSLIDFSPLTPTNPVTRLLYLTITSQRGYQVLVAEDHPLSMGSTIIPDTTCDNGSCSEINSSIWTSALTYGLGYHIDSMSPDNYKQFPDLSKNEPFESIFAGNSSKNKQIKIMYRVNISGTQSPGIYSNVVTYLATPSF